MDYQSLNQEINRVQRELRDIRNQIQNTERSINEARDSIDRLRNGANDKIEQMRQVALNQKIQEISKPYEDKISELKVKKDRLREVLDRNMEKYTFDECAKKYSDDYTLVNQAKDIMSEVESLGVDLLGENFSKQLYASMDSVHIKPEDLNEIIIGLRKYKKNLKSMQKKSANPVIKNYLDILLMKTNPYKGNDSVIDTGSLALYACCCLVLLFTVVLFGAWVYLVFLIVLAVINLSRNYFIYRMLYYTKILNDNTEEISNSLAEKVNNDRDQIISDLNNAYEKRANVLESNIGEQQAKLRTAVENCREKFQFNDTNVLKDIEESVKNKEADREKQASTLDAYKIEERKLMTTLNQLQAKLTEVSAGLVDAHLDCDKTGNEYILPPKFLFDEVDGKPVYWDFPMTSCLFVHDCPHHDISNFIKLISIQILNRMNPFAFEINYWDLKELGMDMRVFDPLAAPNLYNIKTGEDEIKTAQEDLMFTLKKRSINIMREYPNITQYNEAMVNLQSVTEAYNFVFIPNYAKSVYNNVNFKSLVYKGANVGIYMMVFITLDEIKALDKDKDEFLRQFGTIYSFDEDSIKQRVAEFYRQM